MSALAFPTVSHNLLLKWLNFVSQASTNVWPYSVIARYWVHWWIPLHNAPIITTTNSIIAVIIIIKTISIITAIGIPFQLSECYRLLGASKDIYLHSQLTSFNIRISVESIDTLTLNKWKGKTRIIFIKKMVQTDELYTSFNEPAGGTKMGNIKVLFSVI